jgi:uncharacterized protein
MSDEFLFIPDHVPVFPLPEVVLFPRAILPLHVFEPRYREMTQDALLGDRVIAMALLKPGYGPLYYTRRAAIHDVLGVGQIVESEEATDGFNILLRGVGRARILDERADRSYRVARVEPVETFTSTSDAESAALRTELFAAIRANDTLDAELRRHWLKLAQADVELDVLSDLIGAGLPLEADVRQLLLAEADAAGRVRMLVEQINTLAAIVRASRRMPGPDEWSLN